MAVLFFFIDLPDRLSRTRACKSSSQERDAKSAFSLRRLKSSKLPVPLNRFQSGRLCLVDASPAQVIGTVPLRSSLEPSPLRLGTWPA